MFVSCVGSGKISVGARCARKGREVISVSDSDGKGKLKEHTNTKVSLVSILKNATFF